jgi:hypothetical protein
MASRVGQEYFYRGMQVVISVFPAGRSRRFDVTVDGLASGSIVALPTPDGTITAFRLDYPSTSTFPTARRAANAIVRRLVRS